MSLTKENSILVQKYKLAFEEHEDVKNKYERGMRDLNAHLSIFQEKLSEEVKNQKERFEKDFFSPEVETLEEEEKEEKSNLKPKWAKKAFREIVLSTHPDKTNFLTVKSVRDKFLKYYNLSVESYNSNDFENLIFIASEIGVEIDDSIVFDTINPKLKKILKETDRMRNTHAYNWDCIEESKKYDALMSYLKNLGYVFKKEEVKEVIEKVKRIKRKVGTRPVNHIKNRIKSQ